MIHFSKLFSTAFLALCFLAVFIFSVQVLYAGSRPSYPMESSSSSGSSSKKTLRGGMGIMSFSAPTPGGVSGLKTYTSVMPAPRLDSSYPSNKPYPTNKWYTSLFTVPAGNNTTTQGKYGNRFSPSPMVAVYSMRYPYGWDNNDGIGWSDGGGFGYSLGGHSIKADSATRRIYISNALAFTVSGAKANSAIGGTSVMDIIRGSTVSLKNYSDWSVTTVLQDKDDPAKKMTT
ncbi:MAG: hypothetical protein LBU09_04005, partial [Endomicrobium sp.]|nr:hypothetical protein [Endomicrobium sp.]